MRSSVKRTIQRVNTGKKLNRASGQLCPLLFCIMLLTFLITGCSHSGKDISAGLSSMEANALSSQGNYDAALAKYQQLIIKEPEIADRVLFEMGIIYAHPKNDRKSYAKALECYRKIISDYPESQYRHDSQMLLFQIQNVMIRDALISRQQKQIDDYHRVIQDQENEIKALEQKIGPLEQKVVDLRTEPVDKILVEKKRRRLTLISEGQAIKTYKIALGEQPVGNKVKQGDKKTPEGNYIIESRNRNSKYHLSLRISYPDKKDKKRAREQGVSPGGDIMIHGIKNDLSWVGSYHIKTDWTDGCIAVTNEEVEEIARLVPNGTPIEIRP